MLLPDARHAGRCACGLVRYVAFGPPMFVNCCHCTSCQTESGTAFALNALWEAGRVQLVAGAPERIMTPSESGKGQAVMRCPSCRVALWSNYAGSGEAIRFVRVGTLDAPGAVPPDVHIFTRSKLPWVVLPPGMRAFDAYYSTKAEWPPEALARRAAAMAG